MFAFFLPTSPQTQFAGCPSPFEPVKKGLRPERNEVERKEQTPPLFLPEGEARRRGGGTKEAAGSWTPYRAVFDVKKRRGRAEWAALCRGGCGVMALKD
jgi:hypothetical protein